jgi:hypothetical protein
MTLDEYKALPDGTVALYYPPTLGKPVAVTLTSQRGVRATGRLNQVLVRWGGPVPMSRWVVVTRLELVATDAEAPHAEPDRYVCGADYCDDPACAGAHRGEPRGPLPGVSE